MEMRKLLGLILAGSLCATASYGQCVDSTQIDSSAVIVFVYDPVCGCNGVTYTNSGAAQVYGGVTSWTQGVCPLSIDSVDIIPDDCSNSGGATIYGSGGIFDLTYTWANGAIGETVSGLSAGIQYYTVTDASGLSLVDSVYIPTACVWSGDTDDNTVVDNDDILPISLAFGTTGSIRPFASLAWQGEYALDWNVANPVAGLPDYKHIDSNGDGIINDDDTLAVSQNYANSYIRNRINGQPFDVPVFVETTSIEEGEIAALAIHLGDMNIPASDAYGIAFTIEYDPSLIEANSVFVDGTDSWLGNDLLIFNKDFYSQGRIDVVLARKDLQGQSNFGQIGTLYMDILDGTATENLDITVSDVRLIDHLNNDISTFAQSNSMSITVASSVENIDHVGLSIIYPNPASNQLNIQAQQEILSYQIMNLTGQTMIQELELHANNLMVDITALSAGMYNLILKTNKGVEYHQFIVK